MRYEIYKQAYAPGAFDWGVKDTATGAVLLLGRDGDGLIKACAVSDALNECEEPARTVTTLFGVHGLHCLERDDEAGRFASDEEARMHVLNALTAYERRLLDETPVQTSFAQACHELANRARDVRSAGMNGADLAALSALIAYATEVGDRAESAPEKFAEQQP